MSPLFSLPSIEYSSAHEWFQKELPAYLFPPVNESEASIVDIEAVREVTERYNVPEEEVTAALLGDDPHHHLSIAYNLIVDNKRIADESRFFLIIY